jgi:hypothetical protein
LSIPANTNFNAQELFIDLFRAHNWAASTWTVKQNDAQDKKTNFIYSVDSYEELISMCQAREFAEGDTSYAIHRWKNLRRHDAWLQALLESSGDFRPFNDAKNKFVDFEYSNKRDWIGFDLKVTRYPKSASLNLSDSELAKWYFENQSGEGRFHIHNRFFVVATEESHLYNWEMASTAISRFNSNPKEFRHFLTIGNSNVRAVILKTQGSEK